MKNLPIFIFMFTLLLGSFLFILKTPAFAVTIASQTQDFGNQLSVWQVIQELGADLSGTAESFTFRISTSRTNLNQFNHTAENSRIYDKSNNNSYIVGCVPSNSNPSDVLRGLTFNTTGVPAEYEDVTIDFSCRNYNFIQGHKYLIKLSNANIGNSGSGLILFAASPYNNKPNTDYFSGGGLRYANGNTYDYSNNSGSCNPIAYQWGSTNPYHNGCYVWTTPKDDLYFVLNNNAPPPKLPVVFIPGIGASEMKASQDIVWSAQDGHGGTFSHAYANNEKIWVNQDEAAKLGDDDYFDVLRLKSDGVTPEANLTLTGDLTSFGYGDIDSFFSGMGYVKGTNYFEFSYDWRKDVRTTQSDLDALIETAKQKSGQSKVNLVVHSMGGLIARYYISDSGKASKVNKLIELGVPHLGTPWAIKALMYGGQIGPSYLFGIVALNVNEVKDVVQNLTSNSQLLPSNQYFNFYTNSDKTSPYPFRDDRDIDNNSITGDLNYSQIKNLLTNLNYNMTIFSLGEQLHNLIDPIFNQTNNVKVYEIVGTAQPTLGQLHETWWITWPINLIPKTDEIYINGDDTVPLYSASLKNDSLDISGATKIYYVEQRHGDLVSQNGTAMQTVKSILNDDNSLPTDVKDQKISLEGQQISVDDANLDIYDDSNNHTGLNSSGDLETNIANTFYDSLGKTKHIFVKKSAKKTTAKVTSTKSAKVKIKIRNYSKDIISKTTFYSDVPVSDTTPIQFILNPNSSNSPTLSSGTQTVLASAETTGSAALDQISPNTSVQVSGTKDSSGIYTGPVTITLTGNDTDAGILTIEYSLDNGQTVQTYSGPFTISTPGKTTIQFRSIDNLGNEEIPQTITIEIAAPPSPTPTPTPTPVSTTTSTGNNSSDNTSNTSKESEPTFEMSNTISSSVIASETKQFSNSISSNPSVLGISFASPLQVVKELEKAVIFEEGKIIKPKDNLEHKIAPINDLFDEILNGLVTVTIILASGILLLLASTFFVKPAPE